MTRTYALKRVLEHGPMTYTDLLDCTKWPKAELSATIYNCLKAGVIERVFIAGESDYTYQAV